MCENADWDSAVEYKSFLKKARENVELMKARFNDLMLNEAEQEILSSIQNEIRILVIGTDRCNDTAGNIPVLARMASLTPKVKLRVLDSDKNANLHQQFKVNGKRKTPVVLFLSDQNDELCRWVERPNAAYKLVNEAGTPSIERRRTSLKKLYSDPEILRQSLGEFMNLLVRSDLVLGRT
ncbi:MAG: thioredoxin family protein [Candidatus Thorarchaeota archaeon]